MSWIKSIVVAAAVLGACSVSMAQQRQGGPGGPGGPGGGPQRFRVGVPGMMNGGPLNEVVQTVADLNLRPGFTLTEEQKVKIQAIRDEYKAAIEKWQQENEKELKEIQETMNSLREQGPDADQEAWRDVMEQNMQLMQTAPNGNAEAEQVRTALTSEQAQALKAREAEIQAERQKMMEQMGMGRGQGGPGGQRGGRGQGGPGGQRGPGGGQGGAGQGGEKPGI